MTGTILRRATAQPRERVAPYGGRRNQTTKAAIPMTSRPATRATPKTTNPRTTRNVTQQRTAVFEGTYHNLMSVAETGTSSTTRARLLTAALGFLSLEVRERKQTHTCSVLTSPRPPQ
jgi:hypothetical protein